MTHRLAQSPTGPIEEKWDNHKFEIKLVNPANKRRFEIVVVGTGLAGASAAASLGELGYRVKVITFHDSPRRAHSIAAQGGINAAKNYPNDGDSVYRLFYDTIKGGDYRSREANVYRLAQVSVDIIDQCVAQGVPFAREYGGLLDNRIFGGAQVSRTFYARGQTGQQLLLGAYQALMRQVHAGNVDALPAHRDARPRREGRAHRRHRVPRPRTPARCSRCRATRSCSRPAATATSSTSRRTRRTRTSPPRGGRAKRGAYFANPCYTQIHPTCIPASDDFQSKLTLMSESLRNDGRIWVPKQMDDPRSPDQIPEADRDYFLERRYPAFGNLVPRDVASRAIKREVDAGRGVGPLKNGVYLDFSESIQRLGQRRDRGALRQPLRDVRAHHRRGPVRRARCASTPPIHYTMGGLWVDYDLMSNVPGLFVLGEANFSDHGANRLGASALMQGLADGYFVLPYTIGDYLAPLLGQQPVPADDPAFKEAEQARRRAGAQAAVDQRQPHRRRHPPRARQDAVGQLRHGAHRAEPHEGARRRSPRSARSSGRTCACSARTRRATSRSRRPAASPTSSSSASCSCSTRSHRNESCGGHFREEYQTEDGEALRDDEHFAYVAAWEFTGVGTEPVLHKEQLEFEYAHPSTRSYK